MQQKRNPVLALFLNVLSPGLGFLYGGNLKLAVALPLLCLSLWGLLSWSRLLLTLPGFVAAAGGAIVIWASSLVWAYVLARRVGVLELTRAQTWYSYLGFFVISSLVFNIAFENRARLFGYETFRFPSSSMSDTLVHGDFFIADTWALDSRDPERGEVVVFNYPADPSVQYVKRVIGLPGDVVKIGAGNVVVNGQLLDEGYVRPENNRRLSYDRPGIYRVPDDAFFVLGDNRDNSNDSRFWGFVKRGHLRGTVKLVWFSHNPELGIRWDRVGEPVR